MTKLKNIKGLFVMGAWGILGVIVSGSKWLCLGGFRHTVPALSFGPGDPRLDVARRGSKGRLRG